MLKNLSFKDAFFKCQHNEHTTVKLLKLQGNYTINKDHVADIPCLTL